VPLLAQLDDDEALQYHEKLHRHFKAREDDDGILSTIHHLIGAGDDRRLLTLLESAGKNLIGRGRTELFHLLDSVDFPEAAVLRSEIHLLWGNLAAAGDELNAIRDAPRGMKVEHLMLMAKLARLQGHRDKARTINRKLVKMSRDSWAAAEAHNELGLAAKIEQDYESAKQHYLASLKIFKDREEEDEYRAANSGSIKSLSNLAMLYSDVGEPDNAMSTLAQALDHSASRGDQSSLARCYYFIGV